MNVTRMMHSAFPGVECIMDGGGILPPAAVHLFT